VLYDKLNKTTALSLAVGVELAHVRSAASNYSTTYSKSVAFKRQQAARLQVKSNHSVKFCGRRRACSREKRSF
uniref:hypothetical protein n=1 Tax=Pseudoalteromonas sp. MER144-MNA-CIBAN-0113 TaxID=3140429 RepID=UPI00332A29E1